MDIVGISKKPFRVADRAAYYYKVDGRRKSLETTSASEATRRLNGLRTLYFKGKLARISGESPGVSLTQFQEEYLEWAETNRNHSSYRADKLSMAKLVKAAGGSIRMDRLTAKHLDILVTACRKAGNKPASINLHLRHLKALMGKAIEWGYIKVNPFRSYKAVAQDKRAPAYLDPAQVAVWLATIEDIDARRLAAAYLSTGRRRGELLALHWEDVDLKRGRYFVRKSKRHLCRWYPISDAFRAVLESMSEREGRVFSRWNHPDTLSKIVKSSLRAAGLGHLRLHDLRHSYAVAYLEAGGDLRTLQDLLGHTEYRTTEIYAHVTDDRLAREAQRVKFGGPVDLFGVQDGSRGGGK
ncbi:MAG: hypothetical protein PWQ57_2884 [Desulfovibrionales bacterium]|nr:hypothetical protein [Desulfovibrionales bacterium]